MKRTIAALTAAFWLTGMTAYAAPGTQNENGHWVLQGFAITAEYFAKAGIISHNPESLGFMAAVHAMTAYANLPHVRREFRERKAVAEFGMTEEVAAGLSDEALLASIRDNAPGVKSGRSDAAFVEAGMLPRLGG